MNNQEKNVLRMPEELIADMNEHLPGNLTIKDIQMLRRGKGFNVWFICSDGFMNTDVSEMLDLSVRSTNALKRAGYKKVGDLIENEDALTNLEKIRQCGSKSRAEIMGKLFFYHYSLIPNEKRTDYMKKIMEMNGIVKQL